MRLQLFFQDQAFPGAGYLYQVAEACEALEAPLFPCWVRLSFVSQARMQKLNRDHRGIDCVTDVLSFPAVKYPSGQTAGRAGDLLLKEWDPEESACFLGEIFISPDKAQAQAKEYGHSLLRETAYLLVHGLLHLFGYDHHDAEGKKDMRDREERALEAANLDGAVDDATLLGRAVEAMRDAYAPYSGYRVGACLLTKDGRLFSGCNVENASYGLSNCAERTAVFKAVSEGALGFEAIAIAAESAAPWPCGACRQVLAEFATDLRVLLTWGKDHVEESTLDLLLPRRFSAGDVVPSFRKEC